MERIEQYMESIEEYFFSSLSAATTDIPTVHEAVTRLWVDIARYGPGLPAFPDVRIPGLGDFEVPPPPPPPPVPPTWLESSAIWIGRNPWKVSGAVVGLVGTTLLVGYSASNMRKRTNYRVKAVVSNERRQVVVVLGGDTPLALPLILELERKKYVVIASVSTPEAVETLEHKCQGYVRALVLDPFEPTTIPVFLRSLASTLSRKFPINAAGDPFASPSSVPYIHSIISLLTLPVSAPTPHAPLEHISLRDTYLPYLNATQITPLQVIQSLLPLLRTGPARTRDKGKKSIIVCLPATDARVGIPFAAVQAMSAAGTLRGAETLRREINIAALTDKSDSMKNIRVVIADVGAFNVGTGIPSVEGIYKAMDGWSASEKVTYGPAFASILHEAPVPARSRWGSFSALFRTRHRYGIPRQPTDVSVFVDNIIGVVSGGRYGPSLFGVDLGIGFVRNWLRGERFSIGAGAGTYRVASYLPSIVLDSLLNIPHILISIRNALLPVQPFIRSPPSPLVRPPSAPVTTVARVYTSGTIKPDSQSDSEQDSGNDQSETGSEADVESNSGDGGAEGSWVSLNSSLGKTTGSA